MKRKTEVVICGAGIGGIATAHMLTVHYGIKDVVLIDERSPMSLTSDKSTECYRNWWPGPGEDMVQLMERSIDLMEQLANESDNVFNLNRRGYLYVTQEKEGIERLEKFAEEASSLGAGEVRVQNTLDNYKAWHPEGYDTVVKGADLITNPQLVEQYFPYLNEETQAVLHVRNAGWLSAQQYGMYMLEGAKECGLVFEQDRVEGIELNAGKVQSVRLRDGEEIETSEFVNAAGPMIGDVGDLVGLKIPVYNELHLKASINDTLGVLGRTTPMVICADEQELEWGDDEIEYLKEDPGTAWLIECLPSGAHTRPEGGMDADNILMLWDTHTEPVLASFPPEIDPMYAEIALRGLSRMIPGFKQYLSKMPKPFVDGGYYTKTQENRPLASPTSVEGFYVIGAMAGFGIMAAAGLGELTAKHIVGDELPGYAAAFDLARYENPEYQTLLESWGDTWQL